MKLKLEVTKILERAKLTGHKWELEVNPTKFLSHKWDKRWDTFEAKKGQECNEIGITKQ